MLPTDGVSCRVARRSGVPDGRAHWMEREGILSNKQWETLGHTGFARVFGGQSSPLLCALFTPDLEGVPVPVRPPLCAYSEFVKVQMVSALLLPRLRRNAN